MTSIYIRHGILLHVFRMGHRSLDINFIDHFLNFVQIMFAALMMDCVLQYVKFIDSSFHPIDEILE